MNWFILIAAILLFLFIVILVTDGRYFGKRLMRRVYDVLGPSIFGAHSEAATWLELADHLELDGREKVLDVGTAVGDLPLTLAAGHEFRGQVVGVDWSARMVAAARAAARRRGLARQTAFQVVDIRQGLPFAGNAFDLVISLGLLETLPHPEQILAEMNRVLKPGGTITLSLYRGWSALTAALDQAWYERQLARLGYTNVRVIPCRGNQDVIIARKEGEKGKQ